MAARPSRPMNFCTQCGARLELRVPPGEDRERSVCTACAHVHYVNPKTVAGCVIEQAGALLLCRRAIEPARGRWTLPAGYLELDESQPEGALRETREEADAEAEILGPHAYLDVPHIGQTYALFRAHLPDGRFGVGVESLETKLFELHEIPWDELAFPVVSIALRLWVEDRRADRQRLHLGIVRWRGTGSRYDAAHYDLDEHLALPLGDRG